MSISERETYLEQNPHIKQLINKINIVSGTGGIKTDSGWKENMSRIAEAHLITCTKIWQKVYQTSQN